MSRRLSLNPAGVAPTVVPWRPPHRARFARLVTALQLPNPVGFGIITTI